MPARPQWAQPMLLGLMLSASACPDPSASPSDGSSSEASGATMAATPASTSAGSGVADSSTSSPGTAGGSASSGSSSGAPAGPFVFNDADPDDYVPYDRAGLPAVSTGLVILGDKDAYNLGTPEDDANLTFLPDIRDSLFLLHFGVDPMDNNTGLDDDLEALPLVPCDGGPVGSCVQQAGPFVIPDVLAVDLDADPTDPQTGFPNGRRPQEPVMDVVLALLLLEISPRQPITFLQDFDNDGTLGPSLNPLQNDVPFPGAFPYVAPAHG